MSWYRAVDELALSILVLFGPGALVGAVIGLRRWWLIGVAPALSVGLLAGWAVVLGAVGIPWTLLTVTGSVVVTAALAAAAPRVVRRRWTVDEARMGWAPFTVSGLGLAGLLGAWAMKIGMAEPDAPPQTWDAVFHLNALRFIQDTQNASSLHLGLLTNPMRDTSIYPAGWHDVASLVVSDNVAVAANVVAIVIVAVLFPLGSALLASALMPSSRFLPGLAAVASVSFVAFPSRLLSFGTLWPNALGYALLPIAMALTVRLLGDLPDGGPSRRRSGMLHAAADHRLTDELLLDDGSAGRNRPALALALAVTLVAVTATHPNALLSYVVVTGAFLVAVLCSTLVRAARERRTGVLLGLVGLLAAIAVAAVALFRSPQMQSAVAYSRPTYATARDAIVQALTDSQLGVLGWGNSEQSWVLAALTILGLLYAATRRRLWWLAVSYVVVLVFDVAAMDQTLPIGFLTGPWYSDAVRLGGLVVLVAVPLVALGMHLLLTGVLALAGMLLSAWGRRADRPGGTRARKVAAAATAVCVVAAFLVTTGLGRQDLREQRIRAEYGRSEDLAWPGIVTRGELDLFERMEQTMPDDALVLGSPFTGSALAYALADTDVVFPHFRGKWSEDARYLGQHFDEIATDPEVCAAITRLGVTHVYLDPQMYWPEHASQQLYTGIPAEVPVQDGFTLVDEAERARLYSIDLC